MQSLYYKERVASVLITMPPERRHDYLLDVCGEKVPEKRKALYG